LISTLTELELEIPLLMAPVDVRSPPFPLTNEHKAVLLIVIGHRRKGGVSKTCIGEIFSLDATPYLAHPPVAARLIILPIP
jgi:hypothetical protein